MLNLDTHILLHAINGDLKKREEVILMNNQWSISSIVLWEITKLSQLGRIILDLDDITFKNIINSIQIWPINLGVCRRIKELDFKSDPADEIIAATSIENNVQLITRDKRILKSKVVPLI